MPRPCLTCSRRGGRQLPHVSWMACSRSALLPGPTTGDGSRTTATGPQASWSCSTRAHRANALEHIDGQIQAAPVTVDSSYGQPQQAQLRQPTSLDSLTMLSAVASSVSPPHAAQRSLTTMTTRVTATSSSRVLVKGDDGAHLASRCSRTPLISRRSLTTGEGSSLS